MEFWIYKVRGFIRHGARSESTSEQGTFCIAMQLGKLLLDGNYWNAASRNRYGGQLCCRNCIKHFLFPWKCVEWNLEVSEAFSLQSKKGKRQTERNETQWCHGDAQTQNGEWLRLRCLCSQFEELFLHGDTKSWISTPWQGDNDCHTAHCVSQLLSASCFSCWAHPNRQQYVTRTKFISQQIEGKKKNWKRNCTDGWNHSRFWRPNVVKHISHPHRDPRPSPRLNCHKSKTASTTTEIQCKIVYFAAWEKSAKEYWSRPWLRLDETVGCSYPLLPCLSPPPFPSPRHVVSPPPLLEMIPPHWCVTPPRKMSPTPCGARRRRQRRLVAKSLFGCFPGILRFTVSWSVGNMNFAQPTDKKRWPANIVGVSFDYVWCSTGLK